MNNTLSRRNFLTIMGALSAANVGEQQIFGSALGSALLRSGETAPNPADVVRGNARFQVLSPSLVRMEYSPAGHFIDAPSVAVLNRNWPKCDYTARDGDGWLEITTQQLHMRYQLESGPFTEKNLKVTWQNPDGEHSWKPGDVDDKNLGGIPGDIAARKTPVPPNKEPGALSRNGYFLLDDSSTATWNAAIKWPEPRRASGGQDLYIFVYGLDYKKLLRELAQLLGPIPMVPRYVFGAWFGSRAGYPADEWMRVVNRFREEEIPLDLLVLDSDSTAAVIWKGFSWDPEQFPDPRGFFAWMKRHGVKVTVNEHYGPITPDSDVHFEEVRQLLGLPAGTKEIAHNLADQRYAEKIYMDILHKPALDDGMAFWWQDGWADAKMPGLDPALWTRHVEYEGEQRITGRRGFVFCRLGEGGRTPAWGVHRYGSFFTGDLVPYWSTLQLLIDFNVRAGNILVPYVNNLTAGVIHEILDLEIYQRWVQFSAFAPLVWWHGLWGLRAPWEYGEPGTDTVRKFLRLRYRLLPYTYTYARLAHDTGEPLVRGTYLEYAQQEKAYEFKDQYLFGAELLVAPITKPGKGEPVLKDVYLPEGESWFNYFTGEIHPGGQVLPYECPLSHMPLFVRAGSVLPMAIDMDSTDQRPVDPLLLDVYAGKAAEFRFYEDDGTSLAYGQREYSWTPIAYAPAAGGTHTITIGPVEGRYQGQVTARRYRIQVHGLVKPTAVLVGEHTLSEKIHADPAEGWFWRTAEGVTHIDLLSPRPVAQRLAVTLRQAGEFRNVAALGVVRAYRERLREVKIIQKIRWAMLLDGQDIKKQPHALQVTEQVEQQLDDLVADPTGLAARPPDLPGMTAAILAAFLTEPFDSTRKLPELDEDARKATASIEHAQFRQEDLHQMTAILLACRLVASIDGGPDGDDSAPVVNARVEYDRTVIGAPSGIDYELTLPEAAMPGWAELKREVHPDGSAKLWLRAPYPAPQGEYAIRLTATVAWGPNQMVAQRQIVWENRPASG